jgi:hypothetical protein
MAAPPVEPWDSDGVCEDLPQGFDPAVLAEARVAATGVLWALSGRRYGYRTSVVRPILSQCVVSPWWTLPLFTAAYGAWTYPAGYMVVTCGSCNGGREGSCSCEPTVMKLSTKAVGITGVKVDGVELDPADWALSADGRYLTRLDGETWPRCQNMNLPDTEDGTMSFTMRWGQEPPALSKAAMGALECELAKLRIAPDDCALPQRVSSLSRQGVSITMLDPMDFLDEGKTGIYVVDLFLKTVNPRKQRRPSGVWRADS